MGLSESDIAGAVEVSSIQTCLKELDESANLLEKQSESFKTRLQGVSRERNPTIEKTKELAPVSEMPVHAKSPLAVSLVTVVQKLRVILTENETVLRNLDL